MIFSTTLLQWFAEAFFGLVLRVMPCRFRPQPRGRWNQMASEPRVWAIATIQVALSWAAAPPPKCEPTVGFSSLPVREYRHMTDEPTSDDSSREAPGLTEERTNDDTVTAPDPSEVPDPEAGPPPEGYGGTSDT
jgi:hypothetical protein